MGQGSEIEPEGQVYTLDLLERLHAGLRDFGQTKDELYWRIDALLRELRNPNLHEVELTTAYQVELWDRHGKSHLRMVIAVTSSIMIAQAAFDAAVKEYAAEHLTITQRRDGSAGSQTVSPGDSGGSFWGKNGHDNAS